MRLRTNGKKTTLTVKQILDKHSISGTEELEVEVVRDAKNQMISVCFIENIDAVECTDDELRLLTAPEERELISHLASLTGEIVNAAKNYDPAKITRYAVDLATLFHKFYNACRVRGESEEIVAARTALCAATKTVIKNVLTMLKVSVPESM